MHRRTPGSTLTGTLIPYTTLVRFNIASLCHPLESREEWLNPNVVKLVMDRRGYALYFSRAPIPWRRDGASREQPRFPSGLAFRHIGLYAYRVAALAEFSSLQIGRAACRERVCQYV